MASHRFSMKHMPQPYGGTLMLSVLWHVLLALLMSIPLVMALFATTALSR